MSKEADEKPAVTSGTMAAPTSASVAPTTSEALNAIKAETQMTLRDTFRLWTKAILFSFVLSLAVIMEGYGTNLMSNFYPSPASKNHYGDQVDPDGGRLISARWQTSISNATQVGSILGLLLNGWLSERIGYKKTMIASMAFLVGAIFIPFFSTGLPMFVASGIVLGIPWGIFQTLAVTYAADVCPISLRAYMTSWINMCWVIGILISNGVLKGLLQIESQWGYKIPFAVQWVWVPMVNKSSTSCGSPFRVASLSTFAAPHMPLRLGLAVASSFMFRLRWGGTRVSRSHLMVSCGGDFLYVTGLL
ncbi:hypothetical protein B0I37DRAFT_378296 [Chaetomium sp. MPI-CAGE-AT-0009]|nr:hypothetical protein B0I37DRAFT_378296 [Chaetomium sp. MPI-CAGE-AT-0009]